MPKKSSKIAASLRALRAIKGVSQSDVSEAVGKGQTTISAWERYGCIGLYDAVKLADYYGVTLDELSGREPVDL